ncbi:MAG: PBP1A family penicillin-binding protein [Selenomonadaceae bacterium]|nr:PBP1A family penicillin-binding protein [Selenomonadaceae bacterium]
MADIDDDREFSSGNSGRRTARRRIGLFLKIFVGIIIFILVMAAGIGIGFITANINAKPDLAKDIIPPASSQIYDSAGNEIANIHAAENRMPVKIEQIPLNLQQAFVAVEDNRFYEHRGVDPRGLARAVYANLRDQEISEGGSTITQQLAKNAYLTQERTIKRKIQEVFLALQLEKQYTKQEILELYLNQIYFGQGAYGVQAAAKTYFGKDVEQLNLAECALLAGIPKSPNYYSPFNNLQAAKERRNTVLDQMIKYRFVNSTEGNEAKNSEIVLTQQNKPEEVKEAASFINYVTQLMVDKYGADAIYKDGLKIYTTIDMDMQRMAEASFVENLPSDYTDANGLLQPQAALVAIDPKTGYIKAMVGGRGTDQFNRATMAERQPGSAFKPFVFAAALESGYSPDSYIDDKPLNIDGWQPQNDSGRFSGSVSLRTVATFSMNVPTVRIAQDLGMDRPIYYAQEMGITTFVLDGDRNDKNFSTALGGMTKGVTPLEIVSAYCTFANGGVYIPHVAVTKVLDRNGKILEEAAPAGKQVISPESAGALTSMLEDVISRGTGKRANIGRPAAGKTGTTSDYKDAWFVGYTPDLVAGVWLGNDDNTSMDGIMGGQTPAAVWQSFMSKALANVPAHDFDDIAVSYRRSSVQERPSNNYTPRQSDYSPSRRSEEPPQENYQQNNRQEVYDNSGYQDNRNYDNPAPSYEPSYDNSSQNHSSQQEVYNPEPEPRYDPAPAPPSYDDAPSPGGDLSKGRN